MKVMHLGGISLVGSIRKLKDDLRTILVTASSKKTVAFMLIAGMTGASIATNLVVLYASTGNPPSAVVLNDGVFQRLESRALDDPLDEFVGNVIPYFNYPILWFEFDRKVQVSDENGIVTENLPARFYLTPHFFADFAPISVLLSTYMIMSREWTRGRVGGKRFRGKGSLAASVATAAPSGSATASTVLTSLAAGACCGAFAVESSVYILGFAIGATGIILASRTLLVLIGLVMVIGIIRTAGKLNASCRIR